LTWWEIVLLGWVLLSAVIVFTLRDTEDPQDQADGEEEANMLRYLLWKNPDLKRRLLK